MYIHFFSVHLQPKQHITMNYEENTSEQSSMAEEPVMSLHLAQQLDFFNRHYNPDFTPEDVLEWDDAEAILEERIHKMFHEEETNRSIA